MRAPAALYSLSRGLGPRDASAILGALRANARNAFDVIGARSFSSSSSSSASSTSSSSTPTPRREEIVGFVGLGAMGSRMASNVLREFPLVACDSSKASVDSFLAAHADKTKNPVVGALSVAELFERAKELAGGKVPSSPAAVLTSLPSPAAVRDVYLGERGLIRHAAEAAAAAERDDGDALRPSTVFVELSTIDPKTALEVSEAVEGENSWRRTTGPPPLRFLSCPVSGGTAAAEAGTLAALAGGPRASREAARRFLSPFASRVIAAGNSPGDGDAAKLANNLALAIQMASVAEALALASRLSPDSLRPEKMIEILNQSSGRCWSSDSYPPLPQLRNEYRGGFASALMLKDLRLASEAAKESSPPSPSLPSLTPMADAAAALYRACPPGEDFSSVFRHFYGGGKG